MATTNSNKHPSVAIIYGFSEGTSTGRKLRQALIKRGLGLASPDKADIIIAHSGGYLVMPGKHDATTFVYVGANTWHTSLFKSLRQKLRFDYLVRRQHKQMFTWFLHGARNWWYMPRFHTVRLAKAYRYKKMILPTAPQTIVIRNEHDPYCDSAMALKWPKITSYISLQGGHDDIWDNPEPYIDVIQSVYRG